MSDKKEDSGRIVSLVARGFLLALTVFLLGFYSGVTRGPVFRTFQAFTETVRQVLEQLPNLTGTEPVDVLQPARQPGQGVTLNERNDGRLIAISGFFDGQNGVRLMRRDGTVIASWVLRFSHDFPDTDYLGEIAPKTDWNVDLHGLYVNPDGSILVNYEYAGLIKLDRCGKTLWTLQHPVHHSITSAKDGGYWVPGMRYLRPAPPDDTFPPYTDMKNAEFFFDNTILKVTEDGKIAEEKSVPRILYDSGMETVLTANGSGFFRDGVWNREIVHLNKIEELSDAMAGAFPEFQAGDLLLSLREQNMLLVVDPKEWRVKWYQIGPWKRQHDPHFTADGTITLFNNNAYRTILKERDESPIDAPRVSEIGRVDPRTGRYVTAWGNRPGQEMLSVIRGKQEPHEDGGFLVTEFEAGRAFETDGAGRIVWEYVNRYDDRRVAEITEARSYPASYFSVADWSCPAR